jgi:FkbM family methyltransferase
MKISRRFQLNIEDVIRFGPQFLWRHSPRITGADTVLVHAGQQPIHVRAGESDVAAVREIFGTRQYDIDAVIEPLKRRIDSRYDAICQSGMTPVIVDAGANIGAASLWFKQRFPNAAVISIEPEAGNFSVLRKNAALVEGMIPVHAAVGATAGFVSIRNDDVGWAAQTVRSDSGIPIITMEEAFSQIPDGVPFAAKIDIEGFESDLFARNVDWLNGTFVVHIEPHDWLMPGKGTSLSFQKALAQYDYEVFLAGEILTYVRIESADTRQHARASTCIRLNAQGFNHVLTKASKSPLA